LLCSIGYF